MDAMLVGIIAGVVGLVLGWGVATPWAEQRLRQRLGEARTVRQASLRKRRRQVHRRFHEEITGNHDLALEEAREVARADVIRPISFTRDVYDRYLFRLRDAEVRAVILSLYEAQQYLEAVTAEWADFYQRFIRDSQEVSEERKTTLRRAFISAKTTKLEAYVQQAAEARVVLESRDIAPRR